MQSRQQNSHTDDVPHQYLFASNYPEGMQNQVINPAPKKKHFWNRDKAKERRPRRRRIFTWWNLFAAIGIITVVIQSIRYVIIPFLVYLNVLAGGVL